MFKHLKDTGFTYTEHWYEAMSSSLALFVHAWFPNLYPNYVSNKLKERMACKSCKCGKHANEEVINQMDDLTKPFTQEVYSSDTIIRHFDISAPDHLYKWHADDEDRFVESLNENNWLFQFDNELPQSLEPGKIIHIPKGLIHRLIKGDSELSISIKS